MPTDKPNRRLGPHRETRLTSIVGRRQTEPGRRRPSDRHYLAVVAAEARRLARQLRPPALTGQSSRVRPLGRGPVPGDARAEVLP